MNTQPWHVGSSAPGLPPVGATARRWVMGRRQTGTAPPDRPAGSAAPIGPTIAPPAPARSRRRRPRRVPRRRHCLRGVSTDSPARSVIAGYRRFRHSVMGYPERTARSAVLLGVSRSAASPVTQQRGNTRSTHVRHLTRRKPCSRRRRSRAPGPERMSCNRDQGRPCRTRPIDAYRLDTYQLRRQ